MKYLKAAFLETKALYERLTANSQQPAGGSNESSSDEPSTSDDGSTPSERCQKAKWQLWNSVSEVMNAPANVPIDWFVCHTNRVLWSMSSQGYDRSDGIAFLDEVAKSGKFADAYIKRARRHISNYWKTK